MSNMLTASNAASIIQSRSELTEPGKYRVKVTNTVPYLRKNQDGSVTPVVICGLSAMTSLQKYEAEQLINAGELQKATNQALSASPRTGRDFVPAKGEIVDIIVDFVTTQDGKEDLRVISMSPLPLQQAKKVVLSVNTVSKGVFDEQPAQA